MSALTDTESSENKIAEESASGRHRVSFLPAARYNHGWKLICSLRMGEIIQSMEELTGGKPRTYPARSQFPDKLRPL